MGNIVTIIVLIAVVWQIISAIIAHTQQQKQREAEMEARRQRAASMAKRGATSAGPTPPTPARQTDQPPAISAKQSRLDELAARRQQQLEELRRRRQSGRQPATSQGGSGVASDRGSASEWESSTQLRGSQTSIGAGSPVIIPPARSREPSPGQRQRQMQEQQQRARQQAKQQREQQLAAQRRQREADAAAKPSPYAAGEIGAAAARRSEREAYITAAPAPPDQPVQRARIKELLHDRASLREIIIMKELLDPPVAMREPRWV